MSMNHEPSAPKDYHSEKENAIKTRVVKVVRSQKHKKPWYNQGWLWLIVAIIGIAVIWFALSALTQQVAQVNQSVQEQTDVLRSQNQLLASIRNGMDSLVRTIDYGFERLATAIRDAVTRIGVR
jgi:hypothetical protein